MHCLLGLLRQVDDYRETEELQDLRKAMVVCIYESFELSLAFHAHLLKFGSNFVPFKTAVILKGKKSHGIKPMVTLLP